MGSADISGAGSKGPADVYTAGEIQWMIAQRGGGRCVPRDIRVVTDTSDFFRVDFDDIVVLEDRPFFVRNYEREGRFGIDDEPKFWVRKAVDLLSGLPKILKMVFQERLSLRVGGVPLEGMRSPAKEARILALVYGLPHFMHGETLRDDRGNIVRVLDYITGDKLADIVPEMGRGHEDYFRDHFPGLLDEFITLVRAIGMLHGHGERHGDIRRDHIIRDRETGRLRWIDFDFDYCHVENAFGYDLFGLGNVLVFLAGRGEVTVQWLRRTAPELMDRLSPEDTNVVFRNRVVNLRKLYPYVPGALNAVLMHFSAGAEVFYEETGQLLDDLGEAREVLEKS
jgi:hypothetical protein